MTSSNNRDDSSARNGSEKLIYSDNMTLGLAIGSKSTWKDGNSSPRLLRKPQSTADILEKVLPTIPPWILSDPPAFKKSSLPPLPPSSAPAPSFSFITFTMLSSSIVAPSHPLTHTHIRTTSATAWSPQTPTATATSPPSPPSSTKPYTQTYTHTRNASSSSDPFSKIVDAVRNGKTRLPKAFRCKTSSSRLPEPDFEIVTPGTRKPEETETEKVYPESEMKQKEKELPDVSWLVETVLEEDEGEEEMEMEEGREEVELILEGAPSLSTTDDTDNESDNDYDPDPDIVWTPSHPEPKPKPWFSLSEIHSRSNISLPQPQPEQKPTPLPVLGLARESELLGSEKPLPLVVAPGKEPRPLPSPPALKHRPPMLVLPSPPIRTTSLSHSPIPPPSRDRDLPSLPPTAPKF
ncbi:hypothetical protein BT96DRAFT_1014789 [Gymnopus androsaceus JB14]|uniref:Uncharacterized protein n=1 Tax=Gymnopus androsaceus JB14 TaxID=1447944 RepID=A0A6A4I778_9AGAR|nr:hypothetical protein BT96DRAFT_1014789 [Gymnopus androsaceus JB14]